jgi:hypothetical protein
MSLSPSSFWSWFRGFADRLPCDDVPHALQDELLSQLHCYDDRLFFLICTNTSPCELIITAEGNKEAFQSADSLVAAAPELDRWTFIALKPPMGFDFRHTDGPISIDVSKLWFMPTISSADPSALGIVVAFPDADLVLENQSVDTAYTILETSIGERSCTNDIAHVAVDDLPEAPEENGYVKLFQLPDYIAFHKRKHRRITNG